MGDVTWQVTVRRLAVGWWLTVDRQETFNGWIAMVDLHPQARWTLTRAGALRVALRWAARRDRAAEIASNILGG